MAEAQRTGKPVLVDFFATWCGPCKKMKSETWADTSVIQEAGKWIAVSADVDKNQELAAKYQVQAIPMVVFLRSDGKVISTSVGFEGPADMLAALKQAYSQTNPAKERENEN